MRMVPMRQRNFHCIFSGKCYRQIELTLNEDNLSYPELQVFKKKVAGNLDI